METSEKITFTPLSRGRFRCNQKDIITKNCDKIRRMLQNQMRPQLPRMEKAKIDPSGYWWCPYCNYSNRSYGSIKDGMKDCYRCDKTVMIIVPKMRR